MKPSDLGLPLMVTWRQLWYVVGPFVSHIPGARDSLYDLWLMGAPAPDGREPLRRVLLGRQFSRWWDEIADRAGAPRDAQELKEFISGT